MAIDLDKQYGPFSLKVWLIIGVGGIGIGLFVASRQNSGKGVTSDKGLTAPPAVFFSKVTIGLEHVPDTLKQVAPIVPPKISPIMPSNPVAKPPAPIIRLEPPVFVPKPSTDYTSVAPNVWDAFISGRGVTSADVAAANAVQSKLPPKLNVGLDASGNAYF